MFSPRAGIKGLFVLMPILGVGWILGLFAVNKATVVFEYAFAIVNGFQVRISTNFVLRTYTFLIVFWPLAYASLCKSYYGIEVNGLWVIDFKMFRVSET